MFGKCCKNVFISATSSSIKSSEQLTRIAEKVKRVRIVTKKTASLTYPNLQEEEIVKKITHCIHAYLNYNPDAEFNEGLIALLGKLCKPNSSADLEVIITR